MHEDLNARIHQLEADQSRQQCADQARLDGENDVERPDVLVVGGQEPAGEEPRGSAMGAVATMRFGVGYASVGIGDLGHDFAVSPSNSSLL